MKDLEFTYRGFKIVEDEYYYTLYEIGKKKKRDYISGKIHIWVDLGYQDFFAKDDDELKDKNKLDHIFKYIDKFIKKRGQ